MFGDGAAGGGPHLRPRTKPLTAGHGFRAPGRKLQGSSQYYEARSSAMNMVSFLSRSAATAGCLLMMLLSWKGSCLRS